MTSDKSGETEERHRKDEEREIEDSTKAETTTSTGSREAPRDTGNASEGDEPDVGREPPDDSGNGDGDPDGDEGEPPAAPSAQGLHLLTFLWFLERNDAIFELTGFQAKRLYEHTITGSEDVSELYAELKGPFIQNRRDANPFALTAEGREQVREAEDVQTTVSEQLAAVIADAVSDSTILRRLLWLVDANKNDFTWYLQEHSDQINEPLRFLTVVFTDDTIQTRPSIRSAIDSLGNLPADISAEIKTRLANEEYLKGLATIEGEAVAELLQINTDATMRCDDSSEALSYYIDESRADDVIRGLKQVGIDVDRNAFDIDVDHLLSQHREDLADWLTFDREACQTAFESYWDLILEWDREFPGATDAMKQQLVDVGAAIPNGRELEVRIEAFDVAGETVRELNTELQDRLHGVENASSQLFFDFEEAMEQDEEIVVVLHENSHSSNQYHYPAFIGGRDRSDPEQNPFTEKVILVPSPRELGFDDDHLVRDRYHCHGHAVESPEINREFNAIGDVDNLGTVKNEFDQLEWEQVDDASVRRAAELIKQRDQISLDDAFDEIAEYESPLQDGLYTLVAKRTTNTSIKKNNFTEDVLWNDIDGLLQIRYPTLSEADREEIKNTLNEILVDRTGVDLIEFQDEDRVYHRFKDHFEDRIENRIQNLSTAEQRLLTTFLIGWGENRTIRPERHLDPEFALYHEFWFGGPPSTDHSLFEVLVSTGICSPATYVTSHDKPNYDQVYAVYEGVQQDPGRFLSATTVEPASAGVKPLRPYENDIPQLAGLEYVIDNDGTASRSDLRDHLLSIGDQAWMSFEMVDGILAEKDDKIVLDPRILDEADRWLTEAKRQCIPDVDTIEAHLSTAPIVDVKIEFDSHQRVYHGHALTRDNEELQIVIAPWLSEEDEEDLTSPTIVIITTEYYEKVITRQRTWHGDSLIIGLIDDGFEVYSSLPHTEITDPIIEAFESGYTLLQQEVDVDTDTAASETPSSTSKSDPNISAVTEEEPSEGTADTAVSTALATDSPGTGDVDLVGEVFEQPDTGFPSDVLRDRPLLIILHKPQEDRFGTTVQLLCRELYHQFEGGLPRGRIRGNSDDIERQLKAGNRIEFIDQSDGEFFDHTQGTGNSVTGDSVQWSKISHRIQELDTQGLGFLLFQLPSDFAPKFKADLEKYIRPHRPQIVELVPRLPMDEYSIEESYYGRAIPTADALWGYPGLPNEFETHDPRVEFDSFDDIFTLAERRAWGHLHTGVKEPITSETTERSPLMVVQSHQVGASSRRNESHLHYALKVFVVRWLIETRGYTFSSVATETDTQIAQQTGKDLIPDIQLGDTVFEIETLYGTGDPLLAIKKTVEKYRGRGDVSNIQLIIHPIAGFLHYSSMMKLVYDINEIWNLNVQLSIPRLHSKDIVSIEQLRQTIEGVIN